MTENTTAALPGPHEQNGDPRGDMHPIAADAPREALTPVRPRAPEYPVKSPEEIKARIDAILYEEDGNGGYQPRYEPLEATVAEAFAVARKAPAPGDPTDEEQLRASREARKAVLDSYRKDVAEQRIGIARVIERLTSLAESDVAVLEQFYPHYGKGTTLEDMMWQEVANNASGFRLSRQQLETFHGIIEEFGRRRAAVTWYSQQYPDDRQLAEAALGRSPGGAVSVIRGNMGFMFVFSDPRDFIATKGGMSPEALTADQVALELGAVGLALPDSVNGDPALKRTIMLASTAHYAVQEVVPGSDGLEYTGEAIELITADGKTVRITPTAKLTQEQMYGVLRHEMRHSYYSLVDHGSQEHASAIEHIKSTIASRVTSKIEAARAKGDGSLEGISSAVNQEIDAIVLDYLRAWRRSEVDPDAAHEIIAYVGDGLDLATIEAMLLSPFYDYAHAEHGNHSDFASLVSVNAFIALIDHLPPGVIDLVGYPNVQHVRSLADTVMGNGEQSEYRREVRGWLEAVGGIWTKGYDYHTTLGLLMSTPPSGWKLLAELLPDRKLPIFDYDHGRSSIGHQALASA